MLDESLPDTESFDRVSESSVDSIDDTLRVLALMASRRDGAETLMGWLEPEPLRSWTPLVFDRLADLYAVNGNAAASVATNRAFVEGFPVHPQRANFMAQVVDVWSRAVKPSKAREAMSDYVALFADQKEYLGLEVDYREKWRSFSRILADFYYVKGTSGEGNVTRDYAHRADAGWAAVSLIRTAAAPIRAGVSGDVASTGYEAGLAALAAETAVKGRFDAANTLLTASEWQPAINELNRFRTDYPLHALTPEIGEKLVMAYTTSGQPARAAGELMDIADMRSEQAMLEQEDVWGYRLRAAELFHAAGANDSRDELYADYLALSPVAKGADEHIRLQTMRHRLLATANHSEQWRADMVSAELKSEWHSEESLQWAARGAMTMGADAIQNAARGGSLPV